jgi:hypothetical protein
MAERSDEYIIGRLIERIRLLIATSDEIPIDSKLQTQPMLKEFQAALSVPPDDQDRDRVRGQYAFLYRELESQPDLEALLFALRNFIPYLND